MYSIADILPLLALLVLTQELGIPKLLAFILNHDIKFVKWQKHVYNYEIMIRNPVSDSGKSNAPKKGICAQKSKQEATKVVSLVKLRAKTYQVFPWRETLNGTQNVVPALKKIKE